MNRHLRALVLLLALALPWAVAAREPVISTPTGIPGVDAAQLRPDYWIAHAPDADHVILNRAQIAAENRALIAQDPSVRDIETLPASLDGTQVRSWIQALSIKPAAPLYDAAGRRIGEPSGTSKAAENSGRFESGPSTRKRPGECGSTFTRRRCSGSRYLFRQIEA